MLNLVEYRHWNKLNCDVPKLIIIYSGMTGSFNLAMKCKSINYFKFVCVCKCCTSQDINVIKNFVHLCMCAGSFLTAYVASMDGSLSDNLQNKLVSNLLICYFMFIVIYCKMYIKAGKMAEIIKKILCYYFNLILCCEFSLAYRRIDWILQQDL